jgi:hypothetical protein
MQRNLKSPPRAPRYLSCTAVGLQTMQLRLSCLVSQHVRVLVAASEDPFSLRLGKFLGWAGAFAEKGTGNDYSPRFAGPECVGSGRLAVAAAAGHHSLSGRAEFAGTAPFQLCFRRLLFG